VLVPLGTLLLFLIYIVIDEKSDSNRMNGSIFQAMLWMQALVTIACWIVFCTAANERLRGNTKVILIVFYPIVQVGLQCVIFFCGCLALFSLA
jgi:heme/copper-type cytochrome/quinol oxidase subunit 4